MANLSEQSLFWDPVILTETRDDGSILIRQEAPLDPYPTSITDRFFEWVESAPNRTWMAERDEANQWKELTYKDAGDKILSIAECLISLDLSVDRPLLILSGNSLSHALMALAAQHIGVPSAAIAPAYSLASEDKSKLNDVVAQITPGAIYADDLSKFGDAIQQAIDPSVPVIANRGSLDSHRTLSFEEVIETTVTDAVAKAHSAVTPDTIAKFLFTSGTTGSPKAVIQTQRLICSNQAMVQSCYRYMKDEPPVVVDWAPWNHTASGNKVFNLVIFNGGTFYIDDGKPHPAMIGKTIQNLREIAPTWYFNIPLGYQMLLDAMEKDKALQTRFFSRIKMMMYAGAGMSQPVWDRINRVANAAVEGGVMLATGFGSTETGPFALMCTQRQEKSGNLGVPAPGITLKLVPMEGKYEARVKGPAVTPGYWRSPEVTQEAFDEEGFYRYGDAFKFADPQDASKGFYFDGRLAENFKLASGTWVSVGALRAQLMNDLNGLASDAVIAGEGHNELGALIVPDWDRLRALASDPSLEEEALLNDPNVRDLTHQYLAEHCKLATGSASRVTRLLYLDVPLSLEKGEVTDKGSINQRAVLRNREDLVENLWSDDPRVIANPH